MNNLLFITIDRLGFRQASFSPDKSHIAPTLVSLANQGTRCTHMFSHGCPTPFALPPIYTSTLPLDFGGYDDGIRHRPDTIIECLHDKGYRTSIFSTTSTFDDIFGYTRGCDDFFSFYDIELIWDQLKKLNISYYVAQRDRGHLATSEYYDIVENLLHAHYQFITTYCHHKLMDISNGLATNSRIYRHNFQKIRERIVAHLNSLMDHPRHYIDTHVSRLLNTSLEFFLDIRRGYDFHNRFYRSLLKKSHFHNSWIKFKLWEKNASAEYVFTECFRWIRRDRTHPFATFVHIMDVHDMVFSDTIIQAQLDRSIYRGNPQRYQNLECYFHDLALRYVDRCVQNLLDRLDETDQLNNTFVMITGDHGMIPGAPTSPFIWAPPGGGFKDDYLHVPFIVWHRDESPKTIDQLHGQLAIPPTICDRLDLVPPTSFRGQSIYHEQNRPEYVIAEHTHRGPCDLARKPVYLCVRTNTTKYIWKEFVYDEDVTACGEEEMYDLTTDPEETQNLIAEKSHTETYRTLRHIAKKRFQEIGKAT